MLCKQVHRRQLKGLNEASMQVIKAAAGIIKQQAGRADRRCETKGLLSTLHQKVNM